MISRLSFAEAAVFHCGGERAGRCHTLFLDSFADHTYATGVRFYLHKGFPKVICQKQDVSFATTSDLRFLENFGL